MKKATITMKKMKTASQQPKDKDSPSRLIDARIKKLSDWRGGARRSRESAVSSKRPTRTSSKR
jgi:hypothetical protein